MNIELLVTIIVTSLFLSFNSGFNLYALALIPFTYFVAFSLKKSNQYVLNPLPFTIASSLVFVLSEFIKNINYLNVDPLPKRLINLLYYSNVLGALFIIIFICSIYSRRSNTLRDSLEKENTRLDSFANMDVLTELHNRRYIETCLNTAYNRAHNDSCQFSILLCDLDNFKSINDTYGHLSGDKVLTDFSNILKSNIREFDCASRWGGEEFLIIVKGGIPIASLIAERISKATANSLVHTESEDIRYTVTIGVASYKKGQSIEDLIEIADKNLYLGKHSGKNCYIC
jgi:diguanylate cyclase (GGDEF)-like protein